MKAKQTRLSDGAWTGLVLLLLHSGLAVAADEPAQSPLLSKVGLGAAPNIMLTLDDSGSMAFRHMPEDKFDGGTFATSNPVTVYTVRWDPSDNYQWNVNPAGTVPGQAGSTNWVLRALRSPDTNTIFYNPEIRYRPWLNSDGVSRFPDSPVTAAYKDPMVRSGASGTTTNLTYYFAVANTYDYWCYAGTSTGSPGNACASYWNTSVGHDPGVYFRLKKTNGVYAAVNDYRNYLAYSINTGTSFTKFAARSDCRGSACTQAEERQNFANWYTYYRTRNLMTRAALMEAFGTASNTFRLGFGRINKGSAKVDGVSTAVLESNTSTYGGGGVRAFDATRKAQLFSWLQDLPASGGTPLVEAMQTVGEYFKRDDKRGPWTDDPAQNNNNVAQNKTCRRSYHILATDGYWNGSVNVGNVDNTTGPTITGGGNSYTYQATRPYADGTSNTLGDVAMKYWNTDLQPGMDNKVPPLGDNRSFWQNMTNFTLGLGVRGTLNPDTDLPALTAGTKDWPAATSGGTAANIDDLWHAAVNSRGEYFSARDSAELANAVKSALGGATGNAGASAGVATASTVLLDSGNRKYIPSYLPVIWSGDVTSVPLDALGQAGTAVWSAAARMPVWTERNIVTWDTGRTPAGGVAFDWASLSAANRTALGRLGAGYGKAFVDFLRGDHSAEGAGLPFRLRQDGTGKPFVLGDFVGSTPVLVGGNFDGGYASLKLGGATGYQDFMHAKLQRIAVLFAGANDGMVHGFKDSRGATAGAAQQDGREVFAYVPRAVYAKLDALADKEYGTTARPHQYFVNGPQREADAFVRAYAGASDASGSPLTSGQSVWRNYLLGSLGAGGRAIYAIDVTDTAHLGPANLRWELTSEDDADLGYVMAPMEVGPLPSGRWVAVLGNGFGSGNGHASLLVVDMESAAISKVTVDAGAGNGLGGVALVRDAYGQITGAYAGDLKGQLWKFEYDATTLALKQSGEKPLFTATDVDAKAQPISATPGVFVHSWAGNIVVFGTGRLFSEADSDDTSAQTIYAVWDKPAEALTLPLDRSALVQRSLSVVHGSASAAASTFYALSETAVDWATQRGWYIDFSNVLAAGRVIYPTQYVTRNFALVSVVAPFQGTPAECESSSGAGMQLVLPVESPRRASDAMFDTNGDGAMGSADNLQVVGYAAKAGGVVSLVRAIGNGGAAGGGGGGTCGSGMQQISIQDFEGQQMTCVPDDAPVANARQFQRVWRRIINPPIR